MSKYKFDTIQNRLKEIEIKMPDELIIRINYPDGSYAILQQGCEIKRYTKEGKIIR